MIFCRKDDPERLYKRGMKRRKKGDYRGAIEFFEKAATLGHAAAQFEMGEHCYRSSMLSYGADNSYVEWYSLSAAQGYAYAQFRLGECFRDGMGVERDHAEAMYWFGKAADQGDVTAQMELEALKMNN